MAAIGRHPLPPPSSLPGGSCPGRPNGPHLLLLAAGRRQPSRHHRLEAPQAAVGAAALHLASEAPATAGDLSVLIPISTVLLIFYWVANFVVPEMISKDVQPGEPSEDIVGETNAKVDEKVGTPTTQSNKLRDVKSSR